MKIYFFEDGTAYIADYAFEVDEPQCSISFALADGDSTFAPRYAVEGTKLVDKYPGKSDEEVAMELQAEEAERAAAIATQNPAA